METIPSDGEQLYGNRLKKADAKESQENAQAFAQELHEDGRYDHSEIYQITGVIDYDLWDALERLRGWVNEKATKKYFTDIVIKLQEDGRYSHAELLQLTGLSEAELKWALRKIRPFTYGE